MEVNVKIEEEVQDQPLCLSTKSRRTADENESRSSPTGDSPNQSCSTEDSSPPPPNLNMFSIKSEATNQNYLDFLTQNQGTLSPEAILSAAASQVAAADASCLNLSGKNLFSAGNFPG